MANALQSQGLLSSRNIEEMCEATMCDPKSCAYGECLLICHPMLKTPGEENIRLSQWMTEKINDEKVSTITVKREITTEHDLNKDFQERLLHFRCHVFNIKWQFDAYRELRRSLKHNDSLLHIDFCENYVCKYSEEIQSVHFGGSHQQASLHRIQKQFETDQNHVKAETEHLSSKRRPNFTGPGTVAECRCVHSIPLWLYPRD